MQYYHFDEFASAISASALQSILASNAKMTGEVRAIILMKDASESILPQEIWLSAAEKGSDADDVMCNKLSFDLQYPKAPIPFHVDYIQEQDALLPLLNEKFTVELDWSRIGLLRSMLDFALESAMREMVPALRQHGIAVSEDFSLYWIDDDGMDSVSDLAFYEKVLKRALNENFANRPEALREFAAFCYKAPKQQSWLRSLL